MNCVDRVLGLWCLPLAVMAEPASAPPGVATAVGRLVCGDAVLTARTRMIDVAGDRPRQPLAQTLDLTAAEGLSITLPHEGRLFDLPFVKGVRVLDAHATGWTCLTATTGARYVYVLCTCTESVRHPACAGTRREWARLFDARGRAMTDRYPRHGPGVAGRMRQLGLGRHLRGLQLRSMDE